MFERPLSKAGWARVAFGDVVRKVNDKVDPWDSGLERYVAGEHMDTDDLRIRRWGLIGDNYLGPAFHMRFKPGHVLCGSRRTYLRKVARADFEGITANTTFVLETKDPARLMPELLPFLMQTEAFHSYSIKHSKGSVNPYINFSDLEAFDFLLPPIQEQARLVEALNVADEANEAYRHLAGSVAVLLRRVRADAMSYGGVFRMDEVCTLRGGSGFKPSAQGQVDGEIPFIKVSDMERAGNEKYIKSAANYVSREVARELRSTIFPPGTTVFAKVGEALRQNRRRFLVCETCIDNNMMAAIPKESVILPEFLFLILLDIDFGDFVQEGTVPSVNQASISSCEVLVPKISEQKEIIFRVGEVETKLTKTKQRHHELQSLRAEILAWGFQGV